jgi:hypothetical protein
MLTGHILVEIGELLDLLLDWRIAVGVFRDVELIDFSLQAMELVESGFDLPPA